VDTSEWQVPPKKPDSTRLDNIQHPAGRVGNSTDIANIVVDGSMTKNLLKLPLDKLEKVKSFIYSLIRKKFLETLKSFKKINIFYL